jgi:hypothetical protein
MNVLICFYCNFSKIFPSVFVVGTLVCSHGVMFTVWDVGSRDRMRPLWRHYFAVRPLYLCED